jgi:hypothetical protein
MINSAPATLLLVIRTENKLIKKTGKHLTGRNSTNITAQESCRKTSPSLIIIKKIQRNILWLKTQPSAPAKKNEKLQIWTSHTGRASPLQPSRTLSLFFTAL